MRFPMRLFVCGLAATSVGLWWTFDGVANGPMSQALGGMLWKGPLLLITGAVAVAMGLRLLSDTSAT